MKNRSCARSRTPSCSSPVNEKNLRIIGFFAFGPEEHTLQPHQVAAAAVEMAVGLPATRQSKQEVLGLSFL